MNSKIIIFIFLSIIITEAILFYLYKDKIFGSSSPSLSPSSPSSPSSSSPSSPSSPSSSSPSLSPSSPSQSPSSPPSSPSPPSSSPPSSSPINNINGKTNFNTYIRTKAAYNYDTLDYSTKEHFIIDNGKANANDYYGIKKGYPSWYDWGTAEGTSAVAPDEEVWNISYDDTKSGWNITNTETTKSLISFILRSKAGNFASGDQADSTKINETTLESTDFPLTDTNTNLQLINDGNGYFQMYITVRSIKRYLMYIVNNYTSQRHYGYLSLIDENMIDDTSKDCTLFKIADDVAT